MTNLGIRFAATLHLWGRWVAGSEYLLGQHYGTTLIREWEEN